jgi:hypothetical protein
MLRRTPFLLFLVPWLLFGHGSPRHRGGEDRVLSVVSLGDATSNPPSRVDDSHDLIRLFATRRAQELPGPHLAPLRVASCGVLGEGRSGDVRCAGIDARWRPPRARRLTVPHNANAPPRQQS